MIVRSVDGNNDWLFGRSRQDYKTARDAVAQSIKTRLKSFLGDCFFSIESGIDWFNLMGSKQTLITSLSIQATILNTPGVLALTQIDFNVDDTRSLYVSYEVQTIYGLINSTDEVQTYIDPTTPVGNFLIDQDGNFITQEDGGLILWG